MKTHTLERYTEPEARIYAAEIDGVSAMESDIDAYFYQIEGWYYLKIQIS